MTNRWSHKKLSAFTLLELLVVMSIISMLMAIVLPSLRRAREIGKAVVCQSNIKQLTLAWTMYSSSNNDKLCAADTEWNGVRPWDGVIRPDGISNFWVSDGPGMPYNDFCGTEKAIKNGVLWPYVESLDLYKCLSDKGGFVRSYSILHAMGSIHNVNGERNFYRYGNISMPSQKGVFMEVALFPDRTIPDGHMEGVGRDGLNFIDTFSNTWLGQILLLTYRHNNGCNISYADGHVEPFKWKDKRTTKLIVGIGDDDELTDYAINNADMDRLLPIVRGARDRQF